MSLDFKTAEEVLEDKIQSLEKELKEWQYEALRWRDMVLNAPTHVASAIFDPEYAKVLDKLARDDALKRPLKDKEQQELNELLKEHPTTN